VAESTSGGAARRRVKFSNPEVDAALAERVRDTVRGMQHEVNPHYTLRQFLEEAMRGHCQVLEHHYHQGQPWPHVDAPLERGRPGAA